MQNRIVTAAVLCAISALLVACPAPPQPPATATDTAATKTDEPEPMKPSDSVPATPATPTTPPADAQGKRAPGQENEPLVAWRAFGTEPFWSARVDGDTLVF